MAQLNKKSEKPISFRADDDVINDMKIWLRQNKSINQSVLINMAIREFIHAHHMLKPVKIMAASKEEISESVENMISKHSDTLDKLK